MYVSSYFSCALQPYGPPGLIKVTELTVPCLSPYKALLKPFSSPQALEAFLRPSSGLLKAF